MLSNKLKREDKIFSVCKKSGNISAGQTFKGIRLADEDGIEDLRDCGLTHTNTVCCGKISRDELLFRTEDGRYYFSVCDGWGEENGVLYGIEPGIFYDFGHPTSVENIPTECRTALESCTYNSWAGAMAAHAKKDELEDIERVMRKYIK